jgi:membrane-associated phospholipid phosphatase
VSEGWRRAVVALAGVAGGAAVLLACAAVVHPNESPQWERDVFYVVNDLPEVLYWPSWVVMQLGNLLVIPAAALVAAGFRKWSLAVAILLAGVAKLQLALVVKDTWTRERPAAVIDDVIRRGDASAAGEAFVSGHAIIAFALAVLVSPHLSRRGRIVAWSLAAGVCLGRVYVGAHLPLDVVGGATIGCAVGGVLLWLQALVSHMHVRRGADAPAEGLGTTASG